MTHPSRLQIFDDLRCAYTGDLVSVFTVILPGGEEAFYSPDAYDPGSDPRDSLPDLLDSLRTRNGVRGAASEDRMLVCPYTAKPMRIRKQGDKFFALDGFSPSSPVVGAAAFARAMRMRGGKSGTPVAEPVSIVAAVARAEVEEMPHDTGSIIADLARDTAERTLFAPKVQVRKTRDTPRKGKRDGKV